MYSSNPFGSAKFGGGGGAQNTSGGGGDLSGQILTTVKQDMESVEKSGQWVFSCYSPAKVNLLNSLLKPSYVYLSVLMQIKLVT